MGAPIVQAGVQAGLQPGVRLSSSYGGQQFPQFIGQQPMQAAQIQRPPQPQLAQAQQAQPVAAPQAQPGQLAAQVQQAQQVQAMKPLTPGSVQQATASVVSAVSAVSPKAQPTSISLDPNQTAIRIAASTGMAIPGGAVVGSIGSIGSAPLHQPLPFGTPPVVVQQVQGLEQRVRELEQIVQQKDEQLKELQAALAKAGVRTVDRSKAKASPTKGVSAGGFQKLTGSKPQVRYAVVDQNDQVDVRLEEFYNGTGSAVQFRRINHGFYRFGETIVELNIINHKLMARTEDGWNRGKFGPIEKFLMYYENIEREKAGIIPEA